MVTIVASGRDKKCGNKAVDSKAYSDRGQRMPRCMKKHVRKRHGRAGIAPHGGASRLSDGPRGQVFGPQSPDLVPEQCQIGDIEGRQSPLMTPR